MKKAIILIDGSNFYFKLKSLGLQNLLRFNYSRFKKMIKSKYKIVNALYYVGAVRPDETRKNQIMFNSQRKLLASLRKHKFKYSLGFLLKSDGSFHEKGIDVKIAVDILVATYENQADHIFLVSSDTDLIPAIQKAKEKGKTIEYIGFLHKPSKAMMKNCSSYTLLTKKEILPLLS